jgi:hypothetical protein
LMCAMAMARASTAKVWDGFALLAYLGDEPVADTVGQLLEWARLETSKLFPS